MTRCARIVPFLALVLCPVGAWAQSEPLDIELQGVVSFSEPGFTVPGQGERYTLVYDLNLDVSGPVSTGATSSEWGAFGLITLKRDDGSTLHTAVGNCSITLDNHAGGPGDATIWIIFNDIDVSSPNRDYYVLLQSAPTDGPLDLAHPPTADTLNAMQNAVNASGPFTLSAFEQDASGLEVMDGTVDTIIATGYNGELPPTITAQPTSAQIISQGDGVVLSVAADGPELTYEWRRDGVPVTDNAFASGATTSTLTLTARPRDTGVYECVVTNPYGSATSDASMLGVRVTCPADQNGDNLATPADFSAWVSNFNLGC
ncbi:MAG: immunoglobulin domain-containing protein [Phycisphaerales bacterium]|nr:immunoglobulin domain-containing protein [Phycisphaerales bacterium]MCB9835643.1 immunoglobulin domain-containing protein [Phycisphaera sp.]